MRIIDFFDKGVDCYPENVAFVDEYSEYTYQQAHQHSCRMASAIRSRGYDKGARIAVYAPNCNQAFLALLGLFRSEGVWLPINPRNAIDANIDLFSRFDGELIFYHSMYEEEVNRMVSAIPSLKEVVCLDREGQMGMSLDAWMEGYPEKFEVGPEEDGDLFAIFPTGGTTGKPKGVMLNHAAIETMYANFYAHFEYYDNTCHLVVAPMTHTAGILGCLHFVRGGKNVIVPKPDPEGVLQAIEQFKVTHLFLPPTVLYMMLAHPNVRKYDYSSLQHFLVGAAPTSVAKLKEALDVFGPVMTEAFGQTEAPAAICLKAPWDYLDDNGEVIESRLASIGCPGIFNKVAILDDEGKEVSRGEPGEICVQGKLVTPGYYQNDEATAEVRQFGWHHTGDVATMDKDGYVTIVDRKKDMIITGGFNVFPNEIEQAINEHFAVQDCAVIGIPDEKWGESVKGVVQLKAGEVIDELALIEFVKSRLGSVKTPKSIGFIEDLPRSPAGKVLKTELRKPFWKGQSRSVN